MKAGRSRRSSSTTRQFTSSSRRRSSRCSRPRCALRTFTRRSSARSTPREAVRARPGARSRSRRRRCRRACRRTSCRRATRRSASSRRSAPRPRWRRPRRSSRRRRQQHALEHKVKQIELDKAKRAIEAAEKAIDELVLKAPRDGIIVDRRAPVGWAQVPGRRHRAAGLDDRDVARLELGRWRCVPSCRDVDDGRARGRHDRHVHARRVSRRAAAVHGEGSDAGRDRTKGSSRCGAASRSCLTLDKVDRGQDAARACRVKVELQPRRRCRRSSCRAARSCSTSDSSTRVRLADGELRDVELGACDAQGCVVDEGRQRRRGGAIGGAP